jgi:hypothetical protein
MKARRKPKAAGASCELLITPDGRIMAHHLAPELAAVLASLNPTDPGMQQRATPATLGPAEEPQPFPNTTHPL